MTKKISSIFIALILAVMLFQGISYADYQKQSVSELEKLVAPVALYSDGLLSHVLSASTVVDEVILATQYLKENNGKIDSMPQEDWDPSVKALMYTPEVLYKMNDDLNWTRQLGDAVDNQMDDVMSAIQNVRKLADRSGALQNSEYQTVVRENDYVRIEPKQSDVVYVPSYNSSSLFYNNPIAPLITFAIGIVVSDWWHYNSIDWGRRCVLVRPSYLDYYGYSDSGYYYNHYGLWYPRPAYADRYIWKPHRRHRPNYYYQGNYRNNNSYRPNNRRYNRQDDVYNGNYNASYPSRIDNSSPYYNSVDRQNNYNYNRPNRGYNQSTLNSANRVNQSTLNNTNRVYNQSTTNNYPSRTYSQSTTNNANRVYNQSTTNNSNRVYNRPTTNSATRVNQSTLNNANTVYNQSTTNNSNRVYNRPTTNNANRVYNQSTVNNASRAYNQSTTNNSNRTYSRPATNNTNRVYNQSTTNNANRVYNQSTTNRVNRVERQSTPNRNQVVDNSVRSNVQRFDRTQSSPASSSVNRRASTERRSDSSSSSNSTFRNRSERR